MRVAQPVLIVLLSLAWPTAAFSWGGYYSHPAARKDAKPDGPRAVASQDSRGAGLAAGQEPGVSAGPATGPVVSTTTAVDSVIAMAHSLVDYAESLIGGAERPHESASLPMPQLAAGTFSASGAGGAGLAPGSPIQLDGSASDGSGRDAGFGVGDGGGGAPGGSDGSGSAGAGDMGAAGSSSDGTAADSSGPGSSGGSTGGGSGNGNGNGNGSASGSLVVAPDPGHQIASDDNGPGTSDVIAASKNLKLSAGDAFTIDGLVVAMGTDGALGLYDGLGGGLGATLWSTGTSKPSCAGCDAIFQSDGNLVLYDDSAAYWSTNTAGHPNASLVIHAAKPYLQIIDGNGAVLWQSQ